KTTLALQAIAECQKAGGKAAFIDAEHAIDPRYAKALGVDVDELILSQPDSGEQALEIAEVLIRSGAIDLIVVDSVAALVPQAELDGEMGDSNIGLHARLMSKAMRKLAGAMNANNCTTIFINQLREKVGVMFGNPETTTGGRALKFYATIRVEVRKSEAIKSGSEIIGNKVNVKVSKNKVAPPFKSCQVEIYYGEGISHVSEIVNLGVDLGIIDKSGSWFSYNGEKIGQGSEAVRAFIQANPEIDKEITERIKAELYKKDQD
ncbi:MAG: recombinase RecA, partial [Erysipelotrichaceae bacterium]|nr:recombinase RecA [Erysipelotrichaceae bacterium]